MPKKKPQVRGKGKLSQEIRKQISNREEMPPSAFLIPGSKKYPFKKKDPDSGRWVEDPNMLLAAERRATMQGRGDIAGKARAKRKRLTGK